MKNRSKYLLFFVIMFICLIPVCYGSTIRETLDSGDEYDTLEGNSFVIGVTKFSGDEVITASKAATAGANDAVLYMLQNGTTAGYSSPVIYYYVDSIVGWFAMDSDNNAVPVTDEDTLDKLSNLDIYYVSNVEKVLEIEYEGEDIDTESLPNGVSYKDGKLMVNATITDFVVKTTNGNKIGYIMDKTVSKFIEDESFCYTFSNGVITNYDSGCSSDIVIPTSIGGESITGIGENAFNNKNISSVIIPTEIKSIGSGAFANNDLESVTIKEKYDESDFTSYGDNVFGDFTDITYDNELTRALKLIDEDFVINVYSSFDTQELTSEEYYFGSFVASLINNILSENGYNFTKLYYEGGSGNSDTITEDLYYFWFESNDEEMGYNVELVKLSSDNNKGYSVSKDIFVSFEESGTKNDSDIVETAIENIEVDDRENLLVDEDNEYLVTRKLYLEDTEDNYDVNIIMTPYGMGGGEPTEEITHEIAIYQLYVFKDDVLYQVVPAVIAGQHNYYVPTINLEDYDDIDAYIEEVLDLFEERTRVSDYEIIYDTDGSLYSVLEDEVVRKEYRILLRDKEYDEKWSIVFYEYYEDNYDEDGNTKAICFEFSDGVITDYDVTCGANPVIPSTINGEEVTEIGDSAFAYIYLKSVKLPDTLVKIGYSAFTGNKITEIDIPDSVIEIGENAFAYNELENVILSNSLQIIEGFVFENNKLKEIEIPESVKEIAVAAFQNNEIEILELPNSVEVIGSSAFSYNKITSLEIPNSVLRLERYAFTDNEISELVLPDTLEYVGEASFNNNKLSDEDAFIYARDYDMETDSIIISDDTIVSYGGARKDNIEIPSNVKVIGSLAFENIGISEIEIPYGVEYIGWAAFVDNNLTSISVPDTLKGIDSSVFRSNNFKDDNCFIYLRDEDGNIDYTNLVAYSNSNHDLIDTIEIPKSVKKIWEYAFYSYGGTVNNLVVPYGVEEIGDYAFDALTINNPFTLPTSLKSIGSSIFRSNYESSKEDNFVYAHDEEGNIDKTILMTYRSDFEVDSIVIPEGVTQIWNGAFDSNFGNSVEITLPSTLKVIGDNAFNNNYITSITFNDRLESIGNGAFADNNLTEVVIPSSVKVIGDRAFEDNYNLTSVTLNEGLESIGDEAFYYTDVNSISIPSTVKSVGDRAFDSDMNLVEIKGKTSLDEFEFLGDNAFGINANINYVNE